MDNEKIKQALNSFEEEDFISSKEIIQQEIRQAKGDFLQNKLGVIGLVGTSEPSPTPGGNEE